MNEEAIDRLIADLERQALAIQEAIDRLIADLERQALAIQNMIKGVKLVKKIVAEVEEKENKDGNSD